MKKPFCIKLAFILLLCLGNGTVFAQKWKVLNDSISYFYYKGDYDKTVIVTQKAVIAAKDEFGEEHPEFAMSLNKLAQLYIALEKYDKAIPVFERTIIVARKTLKEKNPAVYSTVVDGLAGLYGYMGLYEKAEPLYLEALDIRQKKLGDQHPYFGISLANLGGLYNAMGQYEKAEQFYLQSIEAAKKKFGDKHVTYASRLANLAGVYENMGQYEKAIDKYNISLGIIAKKRKELPKDYASLLNNIAVVYYARGEYDKAEPFYREAMEEHKNLVGDFHPLYGSSLNNLGYLYFAMGQYERAEKLLLLDSEIELNVLKRDIAVLSEKEKQAYLSNILSIPQSHNSIIYSAPYPFLSLIKRTVDLQLVLKSLTLTDSRNMLSSIKQSGDSATKKLLEKWQKMKALLASQYSYPLNERREDIQMIEKEAELIEKELDRQSSAFRNRQSGFEVSFTDVQQNLLPSEVAVEFVKFKFFNKKKTDSTLYAAYLISKKDSIPRFIPLFEERQLQKLLDSAGATPGSMVNSFYRGMEGSSSRTGNALGKQLYDLVWAPLEPFLSGVKKISYSPAGKLYGIAFHALIVDSNTLLMDKYNLRQITSAREIVIRRNGNKNIEAGNIVLLGAPRFNVDSSQLKKIIVRDTWEDHEPVKRVTNNKIWNELPGTAEEVKKIQNVFSQNKMGSKVFIESDASEENLKLLSGNSPQILHIATHGFFLPEPAEQQKSNPFNENSYTLAEDPLLRSGLILAGANYAWSGKIPIEGMEDGIATAYEISQLDLSKTELVVLSACETALGDVKGSEGVFGLQRAFKMAGVKKMILSLWQVPDKETAELMSNFYSYWIKGKTIEESFTQAQSDMRKKYSAFYWAAFVLVE